MFSKVAKKGHFKAIEGCFQAIYRVGLNAEEIVKNFKFSFERKR